MSFAEIILRIGVSVGGWLIFIGNMLVVGVLRYADCTPGNDEMWRGTLVFALLSGIAVAAGGLGLPWRKELRFVAGLAGLLFLFALPVILTGIQETTLAGKTLCSVAGQTLRSVETGDSMPTLIEKIWSPAQLLVGLIAMMQAWRFVRSEPDSVRDTPSIAERD